MRSKQLLLTAALVILSALTVHTAHAQARTKQISFLPFTIVTPGTYTLTAQAAANYHPDGFTPAITINDPGASTVTLVDLNGLTLDGKNVAPVGEIEFGLGDFTVLAVKIVGGVNNVTVENGTIQNFQGAAIQVGTDGRIPPFAGAPIYSATIKNITSNNYAGVVIFWTYGCVIKDCSFVSKVTPIVNIFSEGDERFVNNIIVPVRDAPFFMPIFHYIPETPYILDYKLTAVNSQRETALIPAVTTAQPPFAQASNTQLISLPFTIVKPGNYTVTTQAVASYVPDGFTPAITINDPNASTATVLDLGGLTLDGHHNYAYNPTAGDGTAIKVAGGVNNLTIKNGRIQNYIGACIRVGDLSPNVVTHSLTVKGVFFGDCSPGVLTYNAVNSVIRDCTFKTEYECIDDYFSTGDETFLNNTILPMFALPDEPFIYFQPQGAYTLNYRSTPIPWPTP